MRVHGPFRSDRRRGPTHAPGLSDECRVIFDEAIGSAAPVRPADDLLLAQTKDCAHFVNRQFAGNAVKAGVVNDDVVNAISALGPLGMDHLVDGKRAGHVGDRNTGIFASWGGTTFGRRVQDHLSGYLLGRLAVCRFDEPPPDSWCPQTSA